MNIELKPIAESKVRQLGGDVCGVLVRTQDSEVMAVSEHGRCTRLDAGVMGPASNAPASDRDEFQKWLLNEHGLYSRWQEDRNCYADFPAHLAWKAWQAARAQSGQGVEPADGQWLIQMRGDYLTTRGVWERPDHRGYTNDINEAGRYSEDEAKEAERMMPEKCKAVRLPTARAQGGQGAEPAGFVAIGSSKLADRKTYGETADEASEKMERSGFYTYHVKELYTQPQPAVPEWVHDLRKAAEDATPGPWHGGHGASALTACVDWRDDDGNMTSDCFAKTGGHAKVVCKAEPRSWRGVLQASKDIAFISAANPAAVLELILLLSTPTTPQADGCPECGSTDLSWHTQSSVTNGTPDGKLRASEVSTLFVLGCGHCSETIKTLTADQVAESMSPQPPAGQEGA